MTILAENVTVSIKGSSGVRLPPFVVYWRSVGSGRGPTVPEEGRMRRFTCTNMIAESAWPVNDTHWGCLTSLSTVDVKDCFFSWILISWISHMTSLGIQIFRTGCQRLWGQLYYQASSFHSGLTTVVEFESSHSAGFLPTVTSARTIWPQRIKTLPTERQDGHTETNLLWKITEEIFTVNDPQKGSWVLT